jgi:hypothetical protein
MICAAVRVMSVDMKIIGTPAVLTTTTLTFCGIFLSHISRTATVA